jgi:hypothetical protein
MKMGVLILCAVVLPCALFAQSISNDGSLHAVLDGLYYDMMPLCKPLIGPARLIGGFGALWSVASRIWRSMAAAEPISIYDLRKPFILGFCIVIFPSVIDVINGIMQLTVTATSSMVKNSNGAIDKYLQLKDASSMGFGALNPANWIRAAIQEILEFVFQTVSLLINVIRTFYLIVLAIIGPIVFGLSIYDPFEHFVRVWLARYINVFLWLPVANIFGAIIAKIQENMIVSSASSISIPGQPFSISDWGYMAFLLIAIVGYCTVPSVAGYIVNVGGGNALVHKVTSVLSSTVSKGASAAATGMSADALGSGAAKMGSSMSQSTANGGYFKDKLNG